MGLGAGAEGSIGTLKGHKQHFQLQQCSASTSIVSLGLMGSIRTSLPSLLLCYLGFFESTFTYLIRGYRVLDKHPLLELRKGHSVYTQSPRQSSLSLGTDPESKLSTGLCFLFSILFGSIDP